MKAARVLATIVWVAGIATASRCKPSKASSVSSSSVSSSSISSSSISSSSISSSSISSSSSSISSSSVSSSASASASPLPSQPCNTNLLGPDVDLVANDAGHWTFTVDDNGSILRHTCGGNTPDNDCIVYQFGTFPAPTAVSFSFTYTAATVPGTPYAFTFGAYDEYPAIAVGSFTCTASNTVSPATLTFALNGLNPSAFKPEALNFQATSSSSVITCAYSDTVTYMGFGVASFALERTDCASAP